jgi:hypothetical protein
MTWFHVRFGVESIMVAKSISERTEIALVGLQAVNLDVIYGFILEVNVQCLNLL